LKRRFPTFDQKTLDLYSNLSAASQMIVNGGIDQSVIGAVKASAAYLVSNTIDSDAAISTLSRMITCDPTLYDHSASVAMFASVIALRLLPKPMTVRQADILAQCALYHDVGKTCVPSAVLNKPGKFTPAEYEVIKGHAELGRAELDRLIDNGALIDRLAARVAGEHHEKWDGSGYPNGRKGAFELDADNGIHVFTRIVTISDIYSALLMKRVYKSAYEPQDALKIMAGEMHGFDPEVFAPFLRGVVQSLNAEQQKVKGKGRILSIDEHGALSEWRQEKVAEKTTAKIKAAK
jgi:HD-GYP domain-containing protein (c-di-GMP phosphodiesterase class II)